VLLARSRASLTSYWPPPLNDHHLLLHTTSYRSPDAGGREEQAEVCGSASAWVWRCVGVGVAVHWRGYGGTSAWVWRCVGVWQCVGVGVAVRRRVWMWRCVGVWQCVGEAKCVWRCVCVGVRGWLGGRGLFDSGLRLSLEEGLLDERREVDAPCAVGAHARRP